MIRIHRTNRLAAIYMFAAHYHSGQASRGYRLLCTTGKAIKRHMGIEPRLGYWESELRIESPKKARYRSDMVNQYWELVDLYADKV